MNLVQAGETWTVKVTPKYDDVEDSSTLARVKILDPQSGTVVWILYR